MGKLCFHRQNTLGLLYLAKVSVANLWVNGGFVGVLENLKVVEFYFDIYQDWKVLEKYYRS